MMTRQTAPSKRRNYRLWIAVLALLLIAALRLLALPTTYMREDEEIAFRTTALDLRYAIWYQAERDIQAPLWFMLFWGWQQLAGSTEFAGRVFSILLTTITCAAAYRLARRWFADHWAGIFTLLVLAVNAYYWLYSLEIRPYALVALCAVLATGCLSAWLTRPTWGRAAVYGFSLALMLYVHYFLAFLIVAHIIYVLLVERPPLRQLIQFAGAGTLALLLWSPWLPVFVSQLAVLRQLGAEAGQLYGTRLGTFSTAQPTNAANILTLAQLASNGQPLLYGALLLIGAVLHARNRRYLLVLLWALGVPALALTINLVAAVYEPRYVSYLSLGVALAVGTALAAVIHTPIMRHRRRLAWGLPVLVLALSAWMLPGQLPQDRIPYRDIYHSMSTQSLPGDRVFYVDGASSDNFVIWQQRAYLSPALQSDILSTLDALPRRVWFVTAHWLDDDVQQQFKRLERTHPLQSVLGDCNVHWCYLAQLMEAPPNRDPDVFGDEIGFYGIDIDHLESADLRVRLWWRADGTAPLLDYAIGLQLLDSSGALVAQADGPINHYDAQIVPTSQMQPGQIYIDHRDIRLPGDLPPGEYTLELVVYQPWDGVRLTLPDGVDNLALDTLTLP